MICLTAPIRFIMDFLRRLRDDHVSSFAAETTLFMVISFFPFLMFLLTLLEHLPVSSDALDLISRVFLPKQVRIQLIPHFAEHVNGNSGAMLATTAIAFLWAGSKGFLSLERGLNNVYSESETRNYFLRRLLSLASTLLFALFVVLVLVVFVFGNQIAEQIALYLPRIAPTALLIQSLRTMLGIIVLTILFATIFLATPNHRHHNLSFHTEFPGAVFSAVGWIVFSYLYSIYIDHMSNFSVIYGNLTAVVLCLLWLYICIYILFIGAEINVTLHSILTSNRRSRKEMQ